MLRTIIAEDEYPALRLMEDYVKKIPELTLMRKFQNGKDLLEWLKENEVDLLLLDIQMPYLTGMEVIHQLKTNPQIIFTTAYDQYAVQAFTLEVTDYLLKPVSFERFEKAIHKAVDYFIYRSSKTVGKEPIVLPYIMVRADRQMVKIMINDILYIQSLAEYIKIIKKDGTNVVTHESLKKMEEELAPNFIRIHKSYLVPLPEIKAVGTSQLSIGDVSLPIGASYKEELKKHFK